MKPIFIPLKGYSYQGGVESFMRNLEHYLDKTEYGYLSTLDTAKAIFFPVVFDERELIRLKSSGGRVIQRLAGGFYPTQHGESYADQNRSIAEIYTKLADHVVFQSRYGRWQNFALMGERPEGSFSIINNGVDKSIFFPRKAASDRKPIRFVSAANLRKRVMLEPIVRALDVLEQEYDFEYVVIGEVAEGLSDLINRRYIKYIPKQTMSEIADHLREADAYLHSQLNDICPNAVLEAVATGLPVIGFDSGAMSELLYFNTDLLAYVSGDLLSLEEDFDFRKLAQKLELFINHRDRYTDIALNHAHLYSFEECGAKYVDVFNQQLTLAK